MSGIVTGGFGPSVRAGWNSVFGYGGGGPPTLCPCISNVLNTGPGELTVFFSRPMLANAALSDPGNYAVLPLSGYTGTFVITSVTVTGADRVVIDFTGPVAAYQVVAKNVESALGVVICDDPDCNSFAFYVDKPGLTPQTTIRVFSTAIGPIGIRQITNAQPTIEDLMQQRAISQGVTMQVDNVMQRLAGAGINRNQATIAFTRLG